MLSRSNFQNILKQLLSDEHQKTYLLAVSGGVDSMVLADLFQVSGCRFQIAHINYHLRNEDSDLDEKLVSDFCKKYKIPFHLYEVSGKDDPPENSVQTWARELRYRFFREIQEKENLDFLVTAHHLNDQLETFIINLSKASGIRGLSGIPKNENRIIRPLLDFSKSEIYGFAKENKIEFREDKSNQKTDYLRNKIRHNIVPELLKINENFLENFGKSLSFLNQIKTFGEQKIDEILNRISKKTDENIVVSKEKLSAQNDFVKFEILRKFGFTDEKEMGKVFEAKTGSVFYLDDFQLIVNRNELIFENGKEKRENDNVILEINDNELVIDKNIDAEIQEFGNCFWRFDRSKIKFPLTLRRKKEGDFFFPVGMTGKKKVSKFFKDEKISVLDKQKIWLLCDADNQILGVLPFRQDRRSAACESPNGIIFKTSGN